MPLADAVQQVADGRIRNGISIVGLLAAAAVRAGSYRPRPADEE
jgi:8-oxo-dGDP phosphatase